MKRKFSQKGQVALLTVLLGILGLTVGLSVASRSLADLKQASYVDVGTKALAAAETGAEYGLNQIAIGSVPSASCPVDVAPISGLPPISGIQSISMSTCLDSTSYSYSDSVAQDDVHQVDFPAGYSNNGNFNVCWNNSAKGVEVAAIYSDYSVLRYAFDSGLPSGSNFSASANGAGCTGPSGVIFNNRSTTPPSAKNGAANIIMLRVKPLGGSSPILVSGTIPSQNYVITAKAVTTNGTSRQVQVTRSINGVLPGIFDNVLYSGGNISKN